VNLDQAAIEGLVALFIAPLVAAVFKQTGWSSSLNGIVAMVVYIVMGVLAVIVSGQPIDANNIVPTITLFVSAGTTAYYALYKNLGWVQSLTDKTSVLSRAPAKSA